MWLKKGLHDEILNSEEMILLNEILFETASGYSSRLEIKYYLEEWRKNFNNSTR